MADTFQDLLVEAGQADVPPSFRPFLRQASLSEHRTSWGFLAHGYGVAFEELAKIVEAAQLKRDYLRVPLSYLARHSLELHIKEAIREYQKTDPNQADTSGHALMPLWRSLLGYLDRWGALRMMSGPPSAGSMSITFTQLTRAARCSVIRVQSTAKLSIRQPLMFLG